MPTRAVVTTSSRPSSSSAAPNTEPKDPPTFNRSAKSNGSPRSLNRPLSRAPRTIAAIIGHADVTLGDAVEEVLLALEQAGRGRFRGVRYITAHDDHPPLGMGVPSGIMQDPGYIEGVRKVHAMGYSYETMVYHPQIPQLIEVARACPDQMIIADHLCAPIGVGPYKGKRDEVLQWWRPQMEALAQMENVLLKVGGIGMPMFGLRWDRQDRPPTSEELAGPWNTRPPTLHRRLRT